MHLHILGICGTFMGGLAALAREAGHRVTGCDANVYPPMSDQLRALGIELIEGFGAEQLALKPDVFVIGNVVTRGNPLMEALLDAGAAYTSGPQWLAEHVLHGRHVLAVAGTHGKTSTTAMLAWVLDQAGLQPGFLVGGVPLNFGVSARLGAGKGFVIEADEYDTALFDKRSKFVHYRPRTAILNNLEFDHADIFDDLAAIVHLRDCLVAEYGLDYVPHVHADAVIGWAWAVFRDYDFEDNPLGFHARTLRSLTDSLERIDSLQMADSIGIDFHKTGYAPYISSAFLLKDRTSLALLSRVPEQMPYLYQVGNYHPGMYTLECSRAGTGALAALSSMSLLGKQGYRVLIGHTVEMAEMLRERLERHACIQVLNDYNYGPVTLFRVYPAGVDAEKALHSEFNDPDYHGQLLAHNHYNRQIFDLIYQRVMQGEGVLLSWTTAYRHANYPDAPAVAALKSFIMSPWTDLKAIDSVVNQVMEVREQVTSS